MSRRVTVVAALGVTQTVAWASSYYLPAILADPMAAGLGMSRSAIFGAFSASLLLTAMLGPSIGRVIDDRGGRSVLVWSNIIFAVGLTLLASGHGPVALWVAWTILGAGMALGLYDTAFATLARLYELEARGAITGVTLIAGFASTVGWPATAFLNDTFGWRGACLAWAALHIALALPLNALAIPSPDRRAPAALRPAEEEAPTARTAFLALAFVFAATWFVSTAMAAHLPRLLQSAGASPTAAITAAALVGPAQVAARLAEYGVMRWLSPLITAQVATILHPLGAAMLVAFGSPVASVFAILHGAGNGMLTIAKGTLPLYVFGSLGYGLRTGWLSAPARFMQAIAPFLFGLCLDELGSSAVLVTSGLGIAALLALVLVRIPRAAITSP